MCGGSGLQFYEGTRFRRVWLVGEWKPCSMLDNYCHVCKATNYSHYQKTIMVEVSFEGDRWQDAYGCYYYGCSRCIDKTGDKIDPMVLGTGCWNGFRVCSWCRGAQTIPKTCVHGFSNTHKYCEHNFNGVEHLL